MASLSNWIFSLKLMLFSTGILTLAMILKLSVPLVFDFVVSEIPSIWSLFLTWLKPPYLYILVNCIIITIVASSKLHNNNPEEDHISSDPNLVPEPIKIASVQIRSDYAVYDGRGDAVRSSEPEQVKISADVRTTDGDVYGGEVLSGFVFAEVEKTRVVNGEIANEEFGHSLSSVENSLQRKESLNFSFPNEDNKSPVSARFSHRKTAKAISHGHGGRAALGVAKPKRQDTLESTWKTITDGRAMPLTRHLKKSDTWDSHQRRHVLPLTSQDENTPPNPKLMKKSETFSERSKNSSATASPSSSGSARMRKEPSLSQDELNRRVEAFIRKFNQEIRMQRQESLRQQYKAR